MTETRRVTVDPYVVELLVTEGEGRVRGANTKERRQAALVLTDQGWSARRIAERIGVHPRTVHRARVRRRASGG